MTQANRLGVAFDIDGLNNFMYGYAAYQLLFATVMADDRQLFENMRFADGDTYATLDGKKRDYVIAIEAADGAVLDRIRRLMSEIEHAGLKPVNERFLSASEVAGEPLVPAARVNALCVMDWCDTSWVRNAWDEATRQFQSASGASREGDESMQRKPAD